MAAARLSAHTLVATGSRLRHPTDMPDDRTSFMDSDQIFRMEPLPSSLIVLGGGIVGKYATMFAALDVHVILMVRRGDILRALDAEIGERCMQYMQAMGVELQLWKSGDPAGGGPERPGRSRILLAGADRQLGRG